MSAESPPTGLQGLVSIIQAVRQMLHQGDGPGMLDALFSDYGGVAKIDRLRAYRHGEHGNHVDEYADELRKGILELLRAGKIEAAELAAFDAIPGLLNHVDCIEIYSELLDAPDLADTEIDAQVANAAFAQAA